MNMENLLEILRELHPDVDFETCETLIDSNILDSFDIITLIAEISSEFDVNIPAEEIVPENFNSAKALHALIRRLSDEE
jgi:D-alanine--poly(phosphoribitol) ligase subunit 2